MKRNPIMSMISINYDEDRKQYNCVTICNTDGKITNTFATGNVVLDYFGATKTLIDAKEDRIFDSSSVDCFVSDFSTKYHFIGIRYKREDRNIDTRFEVIVPISIVDECGFSKYISRRNKILYDALQCNERKPNHD